MISVAERVAAIQQKQLEKIAMELNGLRQRLSTFTPRPTTQVVAHSTSSSVASTATQVVVPVTPSAVGDAAASSGAGAGASQEVIPTGIHKKKIRCRFGLQCNSFKVRGFKCQYKHPKPVTPSADSAAAASSGAGVEAPEEVVHVSPSAVSDAAASSGVGAEAPEGETWTHQEIIDDMAKYLYVKKHVSADKGLHIDEITSCYELCVRPGVMEVLRVKTDIFSYKKSTGLVYLHGNGIKLAQKIIASS